MGPLPLKPRSGNDKAPRTLVVQAFAGSCMASMSTSICIRYFLVWYTINPFVSLWSYRVIKVAKVGPLSYVATTLVFTWEDRRTHICTMFHRSNACVYGQLCCYKQDQVFINNRPHNIGFSIRRNTVNTSDFIVFSVKQRLGLNHTNRHVEKVQLTYQCVSVQDLQ